jgi:hypothetical protein
LVDLLWRDGSPDFGRTDFLVLALRDLAAMKRWPKDKITLRNRARVIEQSWREV